MWHTCEFFLRKTEGAKKMENNYDICHLPPPKWQ